MHNLYIIILIFLYIFSFYIVPPITSSHLVAVLTVPLLCRKSYMRSFKVTLNSKYIIGVGLWIFYLICISFIYPAIHMTGDFSYGKILFAQLIHWFCGIFLIAYILSRPNIDVGDVLKYIIITYLVQSGIEVLASNVPAILGFVRYFNRADENAKIGSMRGMALSSAVGWSLALSYGLVFIVYTYRFLMGKVRAKYLVMWLILLIGVVFAGRTGFVGALIGVIYYLICSPKGIFSKSYVFIKLLVILAVILMVIWIIMPDYVTYQIEIVLPFAFEPIYNFMDGKGFTTRSTDVLMESMWQVKWTWEELIYGTGWWEQDGHYFRYTDVGILRNLFFWGVLGYGFLIIYQLFVMSPLFQKKYWQMAVFMILYMSLAEYKAVTIGLNKQLFSILFIISAIIALKEKRYLTES